MSQSRIGTRTYFKSGDCGLKIQYSLECSEDKPGLTERICGKALNIPEYFGNGPNLRAKLIKGHSIEPNQRLPIGLVSFSPVKEDT